MSQLTFCEHVCLACSKPRGRFLRHFAALREPDELVGGDCREAQEVALILWSGQDVLRS